MAPPTTISPVAEAELYLVREASGVAGTIPAGAPGVVVPFTKFQPSNTPLWLDDESTQGSMGDVYGSYQGPLIAGFSVEGNFFGDVFGGLAWNLLGDYTVSGTAASPASTTSATLAVGATAITVPSGGASFTTGMNLWLQDAGTPPANEVVQVTSTGSATSIPITATRFAHTTAMPFTNTAAPYVHVISVLNGAVGAANGPAQGPTHTWTHRDGLTANGAAQFAYACMSEITLTANAEGLLKWTGKGVCASRVAAASAVATVNPDTVQTYPAWRGQLGVGGTVSGSQIKNFAEFSLTLGRQLKAMNTVQGSQQPYIIARGKQSNSGKLSTMPAIDDSAVTGLLANTEPQIQLIAGNGLSGASLVQLQVDILLGQYRTADITGDVLFGYDIPLKMIHTAASSGGISMTGASGGKGAVKLTLTNAVPTY